ncbi:hypothetical protein JNUCC0626_05745 [Lentzea sp. JNUCC 0626]|uniref:hypothetical protein n=1 Tax=Lentzea sp. JNUCC 0626 TaxID=3367513 RepID=UPI0037494456
MSENEVQPLPGWRGGDGNAAYLDKNLRHQPMNTYLDDAVGWRVIFELWVRAVFASLFVGGVFLFFGLFLLVLGLMGTSSSSSSSSRYDDGASSSLGALAGSFIFILIGGVLSFVVFWVVLLFSRLPEAIGEWRVVLADRAGLERSAYSQIFGTFQRRQLPIRCVPRLIRTGNAPADLNHRLVVTEGDFQIYVSVFRYGTGLYLGWQMWRSRRGGRLIWQFLTGIFRGMVSQNDPEVSMMRADQARAMREAVHAACREGLTVAVEGIQVPDQFGFPYGMPPVEDAGFASGPVPGGFAPPPQPPDTGRHGLPEPDAQ